MKIRKTADLYKLTDINGQTRNNTQWGEGITNCAKYGKGELCSEYYVHAYTHPLLAVFFNPIHAQIENPRLWEAKGRIVKRNHGREMGCKSLTTICEIPCPTITPEQHMRFGMLGALKVCTNSVFIAWAKKWLNNRGHGMAPSVPWDVAKNLLSQGGSLLQAAWYVTKAIAAHDRGEMFLARYNAAAAVALAARAKDIDLVAIAEEAMKTNAEL